MTIPVVAETAPRNYFEIYTRRREQLLDLARRQSAIVTELEADKIHVEGGGARETMAGLLERLESERLRVLVIGRFSSGKSTFLNALLFGEPILPAAPEPATGVLCEIRHTGEAAKRVVLHPKPGMGKDRGDAPFEVEIDDLQAELDRYVRIDNFESRSVTSRYRKLELFWPVDLCRYNVDIIDSVGLDDPESRDEITLVYAKSADAIIYCLKSQDAYSARDRDVLTMLNGLGYNSIFFVITYYDHIRQAVMLRQTTEEKYRALQEKNLGPWTELGKDGIKYIDSQAALLGRMGNDPRAVADAGLTTIACDLEQFLAREKGKAKLITSMRTLRSVNRSLGKLIPIRVAMLQRSAADLEQAYRNAEIPLKALETTQRLILTKVDAELKDVARDAAELVEGHFFELPDRVKEWAEQYEFATELMPPSQEKLRSAVEELTSDLKTRIGADAGAWTKATLAPMIEKRIDAMRESLEENARDFVKQIDQLRFDIALGTDSNAIAPQADTAGWQRIVAGGIGVVLGDIVGAGMGIAFGLSALFKTVAVELTALFIMVVLGFANPLVIFTAAMLAGLVGGGAWNLISLRGKIRRKVGEKLAEELMDRREEMTAGVLKNLNQSLRELRDSIEAGLGGEIRTLRAEVEAVLQQHKSGELNTRLEVSRLQTVEHRNQEIDKALDDLILEEGVGL